MSALVKLSNIYKSYPNKDVLKDLNIQIEQNQIHGFLGPNGAGKSTLMNIILGILEIDAGEIELVENLKIGYLPEQAPLYFDMKVRAYLEFVQDIYDYSNRDFLDSIIKRLGLLEYEEKYIEKLSKGYKQRVALAAAICHNPDLLILDEPMVGLDPHAIIQMKDLIIDLSKEHTIFISSHQLYDLAQMCSTLSIIFDGKIVKHGTLKEIESQLSEAKLLELELEPGNEESIVSMCRDLNCEYKVISSNKFEIKSNNSGDIRSQVAHYMMDKKVIVLSMHEKVLNLEEIFRKLTTTGIKS